MSTDALSTVRAATTWQPPTLRAAHRCFGGEQRYYEHGSMACGGPMRFGVFVPPGATPERPAPLTLRVRRHPWAGTTPRARSRQARGWPRRPAPAHAS